MNQQLDNHLQVIREAIMAHVPEEQRGNVEAALNEVATLFNTRQPEAKTDDSGFLDTLLDIITQHYKQFSPVILFRNAIRCCPHEQRGDLLDSYRHWQATQQEA